MGYWQAQQGGLFMKGKNGETIFYPWGGFGSGYIIDAEEREKSIRKILRRTTLIGISLGYPSYKMAGTLGPIALVVMISCFLFMFLNWELYGLKKSTEKYNFRLAFENSAVAHSSASIAFVFSVSLIFFIGSIFVVFFSEKMYWGLAGLILCGFSLFVSIRTLIFRNRVLSDTPEPEADDIRE